MSERLSAADRRLLLCCVLIAVASVWLGAHYYSRAFPEASIQFKVTRESSLEPANRFLAGQHAEVSGYMHAAVFGHDDQAKVFLERELGVEQADRLLRERIRLWRWQHRWFRPLQKEELQVEVTTTGEVVGYTHELAEEAKGARLSREQAQQLAERFLFTTMKMARGDVEFVQADDSARPARTDHSYTWKDKRLQMGDATYRYRVTIQGDQIGGYDEYLKVPDQWQRDYAKLRSLNELSGAVDTILLGLTAVALLVMLIVATGQGRVQWFTPALLGLVAFVLGVLSHLNDLPVALYNYDTTVSYTGFLLRELLTGTLIAAISGSMVLLLAAGAEPLYREQFPDKLAFANLFRWRGMRTREFLLANAVGMTMTCFFFAYETVFYIVAQYYGAWSPREVPYDNLLSTAIPWVSVMLIGFIPATTEEFMSRMFSIPFLLKYQRYLGVAIVLPAFIWGFGHTTYPQQPFFIRGLEVGIVGLAAGVAMLRFGIATTLIWHYTTDAFYTAFLMLRSGQTYFVVSGALASGLMLLPLALAAMAYLRSGSFVAAADLANAAVVHEPPEPTPQLEVPPYPVRPTLPALRILLGALVAGALACSWLARPESTGDPARVAVGREEAMQTAAAFLGRHHVSTEPFTNVTSLNLEIDPSAGQYLLQRGGPGLVNRVYGEQVPVLAWNVRYFRPQEKEEWQLDVDARKGSLAAFTHVLPETAPGADVPQQQAEAAARAGLAELGIALDGFELKESTSERKKARRDYDFVWEQTQPLAEEARLRAGVTVQGAQAGAIDRYVKLPEGWLRHRQELTPLYIGHRVLLLSLGFALLIYTLLIFMRQARQGRIRWRPVLIAAGLMSLAPFIAMANAWQQRYESYSTSISANVYLGDLLSHTLLQAIGLFLAYVLCLGTITGLYPYVTGMMARHNRPRWSRDALWCGLLLLAGLWGIQGVHAWLYQHFYPYAMLSDPAWPSVLDEYCPALSALLQVLELSLFAAATLGIVATALQRLPGWARLLLLLLATLAMASDQAREPGEFLLSWGMVALTTSLATAVVYWYLRDNAGTYLFGMLLLMLARDGILLIRQPLPWSQQNGAVLLALAAGLALWLWWQGRGPVEPEPAPG